MPPSADGRTDYVNCQPTGARGRLEFMRCKWSSTDVARLRRSITSPRRIHGARRVHAAAAAAAVDVVPLNASKQHNSITSTDNRSLTSIVDYLSSRFRLQQQQQQQLQLKRMHDFSKFPVCFLNAARENSKLPRQATENIKWHDGHRPLYYKLRFICDDICANFCKFGKNWRFESRALFGDIKDTCLAELVKTTTKFVELLLVEVFVSTSE